MEQQDAKALVPALSSSPSPPPPPESETAFPEADPLYSALIYDLSQHVQSAMESVLKMTSEVDQSSSEIIEEIERCKNSAAMKQKMLLEEKERVRKVACAALEMLHGSLMK